MDIASQKTWTIQPGHAVGFISLGASLQSILSVVKADKDTFTAIHVSYSQSAPLTSPIYVHLPDNGIRLRFDGQDQRLRLIEIMNFSKCQLCYKGSDLVKQKEEVSGTVGPAFRRIYSIFGPTFPGEYIQPQQGSYSGTYVLSWPGVAFSFPLQHSAWSKSKDHVSLLGSQAASPATYMAVFEGNNWAEARKDLFRREPTKPRSLYMSARPKEAFPAEIELVSLSQHGEIQLIRRAPAPPYRLKLNETSPQDLIAELGPPDAKHKRDMRGLAADHNSHKRNGSASKSHTNNRHVSSPPSSYSSTATDTYDTEFDHENPDLDPVERASRETFWCYFSHGFDILIGLPSAQPAVIGSPVNAALRLSTDLVVTKIVLHGNVPGSSSFNRHRRLRWSLALDTGTTLTSESGFEAAIKPALIKRFAGVLPEAEMAQGKIVDRAWNGSPTDSTFYLPDAERDLVEGGGSEQWLGNTRLYHFPRFAFEVTENGSVSVLTVS